MASGETALGRPGAGSVVRGTAEHCRAAVRSASRQDCSPSAVSTRAGSGWWPRWKRELLTAARTRKIAGRVNGSSTRPVGAPVRRTAAAPATATASATTASALAHTDRQNSGSERNGSATPCPTSGGTDALTAVHSTRRPCPRRTRTGDLRADRLPMRVRAAMRCTGRGLVPVARILIVGDRWVTVVLDGAWTSRMGCGSRRL